MDTHISPTTAAGTENSSTIPVTTLGLSGKSSRPRPQAAAGSTRWSVARQASRGRGLRNTAAMSRKLDFSPPMKVMKAKTSGT